MRRFAPSRSMLRSLRRFRSAEQQPPAALNLLDATLIEVQAGMDAGTPTSAALVRASLARLGLRPATASTRCRREPRCGGRRGGAGWERRRGPRGPLHGARDSGTTSSLETCPPPPVALRGWMPRGRGGGAAPAAVGAVLAKANMHEFAWSVETVSAGRQTRNPYALDRNLGGSSGGTSGAGGGLRRGRAGDGHLRQRPCRRRTSLVGQRRPSGW
jgi:hypothetical protein